jgi:hypothetical protein
MPLDSFLPPPVHSPEAKSRVRRGVFLPVIALLLLMVGCAGTPESGRRPQNASNAQATNPFAGVKKGMTAEQLRILLGAPKKVSPLSAAGVTGEVWLYEHEIDALTQEVGIGTRDVPFFNPRTGVTENRQEVVMSNEHLTKYESVEFLMVDGRLIEWKRKQWIDRKID